MSIRHIYLADPDTPNLAGLGAALQSLEEGDSLVVSSLVRLGRSVADLAELIDHLDELGVGLVAATRKSSRRVNVRIAQPGTVTSAAVPPRTALPATKALPAPWSRCSMRPLATPPL